MNDSIDPDVAVAILAAVPEARRAGVTEEYLSLRRLADGHATSRPDVAARFARSADAVLRREGRACDICDHPLPLHSGHRTVLVYGIPTRICDACVAEVGALAADHSSVPISEFTD